MMSMSVEPGEEEKILTGWIKRQRRAWMAAIPGWKLNEDQVADFVPTPGCGKYKAVAGKYTDAGHFEITWARYQDPRGVLYKSTTTQEPRKNLGGISGKFVNDMLYHPGKRCKFTVGAINSVANAVSIPRVLYDAIAADDPSLEEVCHLLSARGLQFRKPKGIDNKALLGWMKRQTTGVFIVEFYPLECYGHCATWDAANQLILETDPRFPNPLPICDDTLALLDIMGLEKVFEIMQPRKKNTEFLCR